jgi:lysozyme family protein
MNSVLSQNPAFQADIARFFKSDYWDPLKLDQVSDQQIANNLFDCSVNQGEGLARLFMQRAANFVIDDKKLVYPLLKVDGAIGPETLKRIGQLCHDAPAALMQNINVKREASYRSDKQWLQWGKVWVARLVPYK